MKRALTDFVAVLVGLVAAFMVVIAQPKTYKPLGPDPDADSPIQTLRIGALDLDPFQMGDLPAPLSPAIPYPSAAPQPSIPAEPIVKYQARATMHFKTTGEGKAVGHMELLLISPKDPAGKLYVSRLGYFDAARGTQEGAALLVLMATEIAKQADADGFVISPKMILEHTKIVEEGS